VIGFVDEPRFEDRGQALRPFPVRGEAHGSNSGCAFNERSVSLNFLQRESASPLCAADCRLGFDPDQLQLGAGPLAFRLGLGDSASVAVKDR
jgi:hypothetical protein